MGQANIAAFWKLSYFCPKAHLKLGKGDDLHLENENIALFPQETSYMMLLGGLVRCAKSGSWAGSRVVQLRSLVDASAAEDSNYGNNWRPNAISTQRTISDGIEGKIRSDQLQKSQTYRNLCCWFLLKNERALIRSRISMKASFWCLMFDENPKFCQLILSQCVGTIFAGYEIAKILDIHISPPILFIKSITCGQCQKMKYVKLKISLLEKGTFP